MTITCCYCFFGDGKLSDWLGCVLCKSWAHIKCAHLSSLKRSDLEKVNWICEDCKADHIVMKKTIQQQGKTIRDLNELSIKLENTKQEIIAKVDSILLPTDTVSYADALKHPGKTARKQNILVVESTEDGTGVLNKKSEVGEALAGIQVADTKFTEKKIVLNFESAAERDQAADKMKNVPNVSVKQVKKIFPRIMICNVPKQEPKDDIIINLINRNEYLKTVVDVENKISHVFNKPAAGGTRHYILKCDPEIRKLLRVNHDNVKLAWGIYNVRDRYITTTCFHCQRYGHIEARCPAKEKNESPTCGCCAGNHKTKECSNKDRKKCINCSNLKKAAINHMVNERCCESLQAEIQKMMDKTDHGY